MQPVLDLPILIPLLVLLLGVGLFASWRSSHHANTGTRRLLIALRALTLIALCIFLLNPGKWIQKTEQHARLFPILIDESASMAIENDGKSRVQVASHLSSQIQASSESSEAKTELYAFSDQIRKITTTADIAPTAKNSNLHQAASHLFTNLQASGNSPEAVFLLTDGRQTAIAKNSSLVLQARANDSPLYAISIGSDVLKRDLSVSAVRRTITAFPEQNLQVTALIHNQNLGNQSVTLTLSDAKGKQLASEKLEIKNNEKILHTFSIKAPKESTRWNIQIGDTADEQISKNNQDRVNIRILKTKTRVFIAEGAPYWDSKFLAQLLRQQGHMDVQSVYRLSEKRWFRIDSGESTPTASSADVFPDTRAALSHFDLIIFGKNSEHFLTPQRIEALKIFVRDQGGAVLFARGKPYSGRLEALEALEPVNWATGTNSRFSLSPTADGQAAGLFGQALPGPKSTIWKSLPDLKDAHRIDSVKPFTRVLANGAGAGRKHQFPLLLVRRYGQGVTGLVNADGLWKWDFYPEARGLGNMYQEFWTQLIQWMVAYSEFLPGHDYSIHASNQTASLAQPIVFSLSYRGKDRAPKPTVTITAAGQKPIHLTPASARIVAGIPTWKCSFSPTQPGAYRATVNTNDKSPSPVVNILVKSPPTETDNLDPDPHFLAELCKSTGGKLLTEEELPALLDELFSNTSTHTVKAESVWQPSWMQWFMPIIVLIILASEWWIRRRRGLI